MKRILTCILICLTPLPALTQKADWDSAERACEDSLSRHLRGVLFYPNWVKGSHHFYYDINRDGTNRYYLVNAENGEKKEMIKDNDMFVRQYLQITGDTLDAEELNVYGFHFKPGDFDRFYLKKKGKNMVYDMESGILSETTPFEEERKGTPVFPKSYHTKDSLFTMMGCGHDLYVRDNRTGTVKRITFDGKEDAAYTYRNTPDTTTCANGFWLGHKFVYLMQDMSGVKEMSLIHSLGKSRPTTETFKMPMPGDSCVRQYHLYWYDADRGEGRMLPIGKYPDQTVKMDFFRSPTALYITRRNRKADKTDLCRINVEEGTVTELISEECKPHFNLTLFNYQIVEQGKYFIWWSERTGRGNYYLYDRNGKLLNRITQGDSLVAGPIVHVDTVKREIIFAGYGLEKGINPYYTFYYKAKWNGKKQVLLTPGDGNHELSLSEDKKYAIDKYSRMDMPPVVSVLSIEKPKNRHEVERTDDTPLRRAGWKAPTLVNVKAADGETDLYGVMYTPSNLDPTKKYPIISNVYPGPQIDQIPRSFALDDNGNQSLAELGFVVINMPSRGSSPWRGRDFYCYGYGNLRDYPLADDKHTIEELAKRYPFIDLDRVGIYGHSGGGFQTAAAMLTYPDFYKVGVAASGNHDNNIYIQWWGETFHGLEEKTDSTSGKTTFSASIPTNAELAGKLKGKLLLITGDVDKNVPPSSTYRLADALIKAGKRFDMFVFPGKDHGLTSPYYTNLIRYYFVENLLKPSPRHIDIIHHK